MTKQVVRRMYHDVGRDYYESRKNKFGNSYFYNENLEMPTTFKILGNVKGKKILDLGCGPGLYAKKLSNMGAKVKGIDISKDIVRIAKEENPSLDLIVGDAEKLPYKNSEFDIVLATLVLGHIPQWDKVLNEINRVLKNKGIFIFSSYNPVTEKTKRTKWFFRKFYEIKDYFKEGWRFTNFGKKDFKKIHHHKTYGTIIKLIIRHGFEILDYEDCKPLKSAEKLYPKQYKKTINAPHFCVWKLRKK
jgi:ubiquinone/menaquinone biosynthesis C-methylase UbiE